MLCFFFELCRMINRSSVVRRDRAGGAEVAGELGALVELIFGSDFSDCSVPFELTLFGDEAADDFVEPRDDDDDDSRVSDASFGGGNGDDRCLGALTACSAGFTSSSVGVMVRPSSDCGLLVVSSSSEAALTVVVVSVC